MYFHLITNLPAMYSHMLVIQVKLESRAGRKDLRAARAGVGTRGAPLEVEHNTVYRPHLN